VRRRGIFLSALLICGSIILATNVQQYEIAGTIALGKPSIALSGDTAWGPSGEINRYLSGSATVNLSTTTAVSNTYQIQYSVSGNWLGLKELDYTVDGSTYVMNLNNATAQNYKNTSSYSGDISDTMTFRFPNTYNINSQSGPNIPTTAGTTTGSIVFSVTDYS